MGLCWAMVSGAAKAQEAIASTTQPATRPATQAAAATATQPTTAPTAAISPPASQPSANARQIEEFIAQLGDESWTVRQKAQDQLVSYGEEAWPRLQETLKGTGDEEVRARAEAAVRVIEENRMAGPSLITLHFKEASPKDIFDSLARQARSEFRVYPVQMWSQREWPKVSVDLDRQPFWVAMKEVCGKTGVWPQPGYGGNDRRMTLTSNMGINWMNTAASAQSGPFYIVGQSINHSDTINLLQPANVQRDFSINLTAYSEPKLRVTSYASYLKLDEVVDDKGTSLLLAAPQYESMQSNSGWQYPLYARLSYPEHPGTKIAKFKATAKFIIQTRSETVEVPLTADILSGKEPKEVTKTVGGRRYTLKTVRKQNDQQYLVTTVCYRDGRNPQEWNQFQNSMFQTMGIQVVDDKGRPLMNQGMRSNNTSGDTMEVTYEFSRIDNGEETRVGDPAKFMWEVPLEVKQIDVPFELHDLPMP